MKHHLFVRFIRHRRLAFERTQPMLSKAFGYIEGVTPRLPAPRHDNPFAALNVLDGAVSSNANRAIVIRAPRREATHMRIQINQRLAGLLWLANK